MKITKLFFITCLSITPYLLNGMESKRGLDIEEGTEEKSKSSIKKPKKLFLNKKAKELKQQEKGIKKLIQTNEINILSLPSINPEKIPDYLLQLLLDKKSSLNCIDLSPKETRGFDASTAQTATDVIKTIIEKIASAIKTKADKEVKKITLSIDKMKLSNMSDEDFEKLPIRTGDKKDPTKYDEDPNISKIKIGNATIYIIPEECKSGWSTAQKVFTVLGYVISVVGWGFGLYVTFNPLTGCSSETNPCNCTVGTTTPAGTFGGY